MAAKILKGASRSKTGKMMVMTMKMIKRKMIKMAELFLMMMMKMIRMPSMDVRCRCN